MLNIQAIVNSPKFSSPKPEMINFVKILPHQIKFALYSMFGINMSPRMSVNKISYN